jgi:hypothetical protein
MKEPDREGCLEPPEDAPFLALLGLLALAAEKMRATENFAALAARGPESLAR